MNPGASACRPAHSCPRTTCSTDPSPPSHRCSGPSHRCPVGPPGPIRASAPLSTGPRFEVSLGTYVKLLVALVQQVVLRLPLLRLSLQRVQIVGLVHVHAGLRITENQGTNEGIRAIDPRLQLRCLALQLDVPSVDGRTNNYSLRRDSLSSSNLLMYDTS